MFKLRAAIGCLLIMGIHSSALEPKYQKRKIQKDSHAQKAQSLKNLLIQYRKDSDLPHLHELATADTAKITEGLKNILPAATFNTIIQTLSDLDGYLNSSDGQAIKAEIAKEVVENLCYMCAAFDGFSYALLTGTIKKDDVTGVARIKNAISWFGSWFQRKVGYRGVHDVHDKEAFKKKNNAFVNEFLETILNTITIYHNNIISKFSSAPEVEAYAKGKLDILEALGTQKAQAANLYNKNPQLGYRYKLIASNNIKLAGGTEIFALIDGIDALHKKEYKRIIGHYRTILAAAEKSKKKHQSTKADEQFQKMQMLTRKHTYEINQLKIQIKQLKQQKQTPESKKQILALDKQIKDSEALYKRIITTLQIQYDKDLLRQKIIQLKHKLIELELELEQQTETKDTLSKEITQLKNKLTMFAQQTEAVNDIERINKLKEEIRKIEDRYQSISKTLQEQYDKDRKANGIYSK